jgi:putative heme transporter
MRNAGKVRRATVSVLVGVAATAMVVLLPHVVGTTWTTVGGLLGQISMAGVAGLAVVWIAGLFSHSFVLAASLPGLTKRRGLTLSLTGSAVANVLPLGGAAGTGLNFAMTRRWGFSSTAFAGFLAVTTLVNVVTKLGVVVIALALIPAVHTALPAGRTGLLLVPVLAALGLVAWVLLSAPAAAWCGRGLDRLAGLVRSGQRPALESSLPELRLSILRVFRGGWMPMSAGMAGYLFLQAALLWLCFHVLGASLGVPALIAGLAVERLLTLIPITPGGAGVVEVGTTAALIALGGDPAVVTAGLLLFRGFTFLLEIPVGGTTLAIWLLRNRRGTAREVVAAS